MPVLALNWTKSRANSNFWWKSDRPQMRTIKRRFSGFGIKNSIRDERESCEDGPPPTLLIQDFYGLYMKILGLQAGPKGNFGNGDFSCKAKRSGWRSRTRQGESPKQYRLWLVSRRAHLYFSRGVWVSKVVGHPSSSNVPQWNLAKPRNTLYQFFTIKPFKMGLIYAAYNLHDIIWFIIYKTILRFIKFPIGINEKSNFWLFNVSQNLERSLRFLKRGINDLGINRYSQV